MYLPLYNVIHAHVLLSPGAKKKQVRDGKHGWVIDQNVRGFPFILSCELLGKQLIVPLNMKGCICQFVEWQIHPFKSKGTWCSVIRRSMCDGDNTPLDLTQGGGPGVVVKAAWLESRRSWVRTPLWPSSFKETLKLHAWKVGDRGFEPHSDLRVSKKQNVSSPLTRNDSLVEVACSNFLYMEGSVISFISPSWGGFPGPV